MHISLDVTYMYTNFGGCVPFLLIVVLIILDNKPVYKIKEDKHFTSHYLHSLKHLQQTVAIL